MAYAITDFSKVHILYTDDGGNPHSIPQRTVCQVAVGNSLAAGTEPPGRPSKWKLRHIYCVAVGAGPGGATLRKRIVIGSATNAHFQSGTAPGAMDGVASWIVEGRVGELRST